MIPRLVPEISPLDAFCDVVVVGIGDSSSWIVPNVSMSHRLICTHKDSIDKPSWHTHNACAAVLCSSVTISQWQLQSFCSSFWVLAGRTLLPENIMDSTFQVKVKPGRVFFTDIDRVYPMVATPRGLALIINNETFACPSFYTQRYVVDLQG